MKYLCLIYDEETRWDRMSKEEATAGYGRYYTFTDGIRSSGHYVNGNSLKPTSTATTVWMRNGSVSTTDGPYAETKEQLGGSYLVEARDLNEAIQLAARIPGAQFGSIEVRPVAEMS